MRVIVVGVLLFLSVGLILCQSLVNEYVEKEINLETNLVNLKLNVNVRNAGDRPATSYDVYFTKDEAAHISDVWGIAGNSGKRVRLSLANDAKGAKVSFRLPTPIGAGETQNIHILAVLTHAVTAFPAEITQSQNQLMVYEGNLYLYSPYTTEKIKVSVKTFSPSIESYTHKKPFTAKSNVISYGPYSNVAPFSTENVRVHYLNNFPFMTLTNVLKEVEVSHWGHISFEEHVDLAHTGAKLTGGFSRLDYQRNPQKSPSHFRLVVAQLPASSSGIYYRDVIGNVSTSRVRVEAPENGEAYTHFEIFPRYLLFGGWKTQFYFGYVAPLSEFLGITKDGLYSLNVPFGTTIVNPVVDQLTVNIILPEGVSDVQVSGVDGLEESRSVRKTYLDTKGRTVVTLKKSNVVGGNTDTLTVTYRVASLSLFTEPILLIGGFFVLFLFIIFAKRFQLTIGQAQKTLKKAKDEALELSIKLQKIDSEIKSLSSSEGETKAASDKVKQLVASFKSEIPEGFSVQARLGAFEKAALELVSQKKGANAKDAKKRGEDYEKAFKELDSEFTSKL
eukprot:c12690_g1_i1.p1 GENE.c12690_g1_i1~~c12690_g1_i1.p1  ORF type:complete len:561 (+),score=210.34 c12690_g1_i1:51-1733(+)